MYNLKKKIQYLIFYTGISDDNSYRESDVFEIKYSAFNRLSFTS